MWAQAVACITGNHRNIEMADELAHLRFYSAIRRGAVLGIQRPDIPFPEQEPPTSPRAQVNIALSFDSKHTATLQKLAFVGPGEIVGLDSRTIVRAYPRPDENEAESDFLAHLEFDQADLPWRYTPARMSGDNTDRSDRIRPWVSLIVLSETDSEFAYDDKLTADGNQKLPKLTVTAPQVLPDPGYLWAWSHVQVAGQPGSMKELVALLDGKPGPVVARLLAPRRLVNNKAYRAFLVPTFERGRLAGLGQAVPDTVDALKPAWKYNGTADVELPVYYSWRFQTGSVASFEAAVADLKPASSLPEGVGARALDVHAPGDADWPSPLAAGVVDLGGALRLPSTGTPPTEPLSLQSDWLAELAEQTAAVTSGDSPTLGPPLYGRWYAAAGALGTRAQRPWFYDLNSDPRWRVAAGLGTEVVKRDQQSLMVAAWGQAERLVRMNQTRKVMQTGRAVFGSLLQRMLLVGTMGRQISLTFPLWGAIWKGESTIWKEMGGTAIPWLLGPWWRRLLSPQGPIGRKNPGVTGIPDSAITGLIDGTLSGSRPPVQGIIGRPVEDTPAGMNSPEVETVANTMDANERTFWGLVLFWTCRDLLVTESGRYWWHLRKLMRFGLQLARMGSSCGLKGTQNAAGRGTGEMPTADQVRDVDAATGTFPYTDGTDLSNPANWQPTRPAASPGAVDSVDWDLFRKALIAIIGAIRPPAAGPVYKVVSLSGIIDALKAALATSSTFAQAASARFRLSSGVAWTVADPLEPVLVPPKLDRPMWRELRDLSPEWILPGVGNVPRNSVALLSTNRKFIESFMVGLNHEMTRELVWHNYPTDQRGTYFGQFWDFRGWVKGSANEPDRTDAEFMDITSISGWPAQTDLGAHPFPRYGSDGQPLPAAEHLVLLVRGDVIRRYPSVMVYASKADSTSGTPTFSDSQPQSHPVFQGMLTGDTAFYGFELTQSAVKGSDGGPGWFFVLQEHPSEPRFQKKGSGTGANVEALDYGEPVGDRTDTSAGLVARKGYDQPARVAIYGSSLLP
jgi:hypothetical protein